MHTSEDALPPGRQAGRRTKTARKTPPNRPGPPAQKTFCPHPFVCMFVSNTEAPAKKTQQPASGRPHSRRATVHSTMHRSACLTAHDAYSHNRRL